jgi:hypothetical protein
MPLNQFHRQSKLEIPIKDQTRDNPQAADKIIPGDSPAASGLLEQSSCGSDDARATWN